MQLKENLFIDFSFLTGATKNISIKNIGLDESRVINKEYLDSLDDVYKCNICFKIMDNPTDYSHLSKHNFPWTKRKAGV